MPNDYSAILSAEAVASYRRQASETNDPNREGYFFSRIEASHTALLALCGELRDALDDLRPLAICHAALSEGRMRFKIALDGEFIEFFRGPSQSDFIGSVLHGIVEFNKRISIAELKEIAEYMVKQEGSSPSMQANFLPH